jgi:hypothetical protein
MELTQLLLVAQPLLLRAVVVGLAVILLVVMAVLVEVQMGAICPQRELEQRVKEMLVVRQLLITEAVAVVLAL